MEDILVFFYSFICFLSESETVGDSLRGRRPLVGIPSLCFFYVVERFVVSTLKMSLLGI